MNYANAGAGLRKLFIAQIGSVVCNVLLVIPLINLAGAIGALVFLILSLIGLNEAGKDIDGCKKAFQITIEQLALTVISREAGSLIRSFLRQSSLQASCPRISFVPRLPQYSVHAHMTTLLPKESWCGRLTSYATPPGSLYPSSPVSRS